MADVRDGEEYFRSLRRDAEAFRKHGDRDGAGGLLSEELRRVVDSHMRRKKFDYDGRSLEAEEKAEESRTLLVGFKDLVLGADVRFSAVFETAQDLASLRRELLRQFRDLLNDADEGYYWRVRRDAEAFRRPGGRPGAGKLVFGEIERVVHSHMRRNKFDHKGGELDAKEKAEESHVLLVGFAGFLFPKAGERLPEGRAGGLEGGEGGAKVAENLPADDKALAPFRAVFELAEDLASLRRGLRRQFRDFLKGYINGSNVGHLIDNNLVGVKRRFKLLGLRRCGWKRGAYWSEEKRTPAQQGQIRLALGDVESRLDDALRSALRGLEPLTNDRRLTQGYGPENRKRLAGLLKDNFRVEVPGMGTVVFIEEYRAKQVLRMLIQKHFDELFTIPLVPSPHENKDGGVSEEQEQPGVERPMLEDAMGAVESVLAVMETLAFKMKPARPGGTTGADVREVLRLYVAGDGNATSRDVEAALKDGHARTPGSRPLDLKNLLEAMPTGQSALDAVSDSDLRRRLERLLDEFRNPTYRPAPRSHVTVQAQLQRFEDLWTDQTADLGPEASADAHRWLFDLLFLEVGQYPPDAGESGPGAAAVEGREE